jgi:hypothetical protein
MPSIFNATLFNKAIFNTRFIAATGYTKRKFKRLPKQLLSAQTTLKVSSKLMKPVSLKFESKILTELQSTIESKILTNRDIDTISKIMSEVYKPIGSLISKDVDITVKGNINVMELNSNKMIKYNTIQNILSLID